MDSKKLAKIAIETGRNARDWASINVQRDLALARCALHLYWCDDKKMLPMAAITAEQAIATVIQHFNSIDK
jgi:hypothetical protein